MFSNQITRLVFVLAISMMAYASTAQERLKTPRVSPPAQLTQTIGITEIEVNYSRPSVVLNGQDRTGQIWGNKAWYGFIDVGGAKIPWRAGANENTVISFSQDVKIQGQELKAGKYGLQMALSEDGPVTVIFSNNSSLWGSFGYNPEEDALRVESKLEDAPFTSGLLTYEFIEIGKDYGVLALLWEKKYIPIKIEVDIKEAVASHFAHQLHALGKKNHQAFTDAASYCAVNNFNHKQALEWIDHSIEVDKNFQNLFVKAQLTYQTGKEKAALKINDEAVSLANNGQVNYMGYTMLNIGKPEKAVEYFKINAERHPDDPNVFDSLGEGYMAVGEKKKAIESFKKSLSMNPADNVKANSIANLKKLGVDYEGSK